MTTVLFLFYFLSPKFKGLYFFKSHFFSPLHSLLLFFFLTIISSPLSYSFSPIISPSFFLKLLTEMDGLDSRKFIFIIAATNRYFPITKKIITIRKNKYGNCLLNWTISMDFFYLKVFFWGGQTGYDRPGPFKTRAAGQTFICSAARLSG